MFDSCFEEQAMLEIQDVTEGYIVEHIKGMLSVAIFAKCITLKDLQFINKIKSQIVFTFMLLL